LKIAAVTAAVAECPEDFLPEFRKSVAGPGDSAVMFNQSPDEVIFSFVRAARDRADGLQPFAQEGDDAIPLGGFD